MFMFDRAILHLDLDSFFVSVARIIDESLVGIPLLIGGYSDRAVVASCSYEARKFGIRSAMPVKKALQLCPSVKVVKGDMPNYSKYSQMVTDIIKEEAPLFQKSSIDEFFVDLTGMDKHIGAWQWSQNLRQRIMRETQLPISMALSTNKLVSKIATDEAKPCGELLIPPGHEMDFLAPLAVGKIPFIGKVAQQKLKRLGVHTIADLRNLSLDLLKIEFKNQAQDIWNKARGIDNSPVSPYRERKSISSERTFHKDTTDTVFLKDKLTELVFKLGYELRQKQKLSREVAIKIRYDDFSTFSKQRAIDYTVHDDVIKACAHQLFDELYEKGRPVRLIGVRVGKLEEGSQQLDFFRDTGENDNLLQALDDLRNKFGAKIISKGTSFKKK